MVFVCKLLFAALCCFGVMSAIGCGDYSKEESCNYINKYTYFACKWNETDSTKCGDGTCDDFGATEAACKAAPIKCAWNSSYTGSLTPCSSASCTHFDSDVETECTNNYANITCKYRSDGMVGYRCLSLSCADYNETACGATDTKPTSSKCEWDADAATPVCKRTQCSDYVDSDSCLASDGPTGKLSCYWNETSLNKCSSASCYNFAPTSTSEQSLCENNNGKLDCVFDGTYTSALLRCSPRSCSDQKSENDCKNWGGCWWSNLRSRCLTSSCSDLSESQTVCESAHPLCHYDGSCKEGADSGAMAMSVPSLVAVLLLLMYWLAI